MGPSGYLPNVSMALRRDFSLADTWKRGHRKGSIFYGTGAVEGWFGNWATGHNYFTAYII